MNDLLAGIGDALTLVNIVFVALGVLTGITVGAIPGLNGPMAIALALPVTFYLSPLGGIAYLIGIMKGGTYGGSISAILLNTPGSPEAAATAFDGYPLAQQGKGLKAMKMALYSSVTGDTFSDLVLFAVAAPIAVVSLMMGPPEMSACAVARPGRGPGTDRRGRQVRLDSRPGRADGGRRHLPSRNASAFV